MGNQSADQRVFEVLGTVTVSCYVKVRAKSTAEALEIARSGQLTEAWEQDDDGEPEWTNAGEVRS